jgi:hypothetical protein
LSILRNHVLSYHNYNLFVKNFLSKFDSVTNKCKNEVDMVGVAENEAEVEQQKEAMIEDYMKALLRPDKIQTTNPRGALVIDLQGGSRDPLAHWHDYYKSLDELDIELKDAVRLRADLIYGGRWYAKSGKLLDALFKIRTRDLEEKVKIPDPENAEMLFQQEEFKKIKEYFTLPQEQRWSQKMVENRLGLNQNAYTMLSALEDNYLVPLRTPPAGRPLPGDSPN